MDASADHPLQQQTLHDEKSLPPPRLVVFQPNGQIELAVDPKRITPPPPPPTSSNAITNLIHGNLPTMAISPSTRNAIFPAEYEVWSRELHQQKILFYVTLAIDLIYLLALLIIRAIWSANDIQDSDDESSAAVFFISKPSELSMAFIIAAILSDGLATYAVYSDLATVVTLFIIWSLLLAAFSIGRLPLFFIIIRVMIVLLAIQLRISMGRINTLQAPMNAAGWVARSTRQVGAQFGRWGQAFTSRTTMNEEPNVEEGGNVPAQRNNNNNNNDDIDSNRSRNRANTVSQQQDSGQLAAATYLEQMDPGFILQWARAASNRRVAETMNQGVLVHPLTPLITVTEPNEDENFEGEHSSRRRSTDDDV